MATKALTKQLAASKEARKFITRVYLWMSIALLLSGLPAFIISKNHVICTEIIMYQTRGIFK